MLRLRKRTAMSLRKTHATDVASIYSFSQEKERSHYVMQALGKRINC